MVVIPGRIRMALPWIFLVMLAALVFLPSLRSQYLNYDDPVHVSSDLFFRPWSIFTTPDTANRTYIPLAIVSAYVENIFFAANPHMTHWINFFLHLCAAGLVYLLSCRLGVAKPAAYIAAFVFALHPMHIESVAWATGRKDLLYTNFYLIALLFYLEYLDNKKGKAYIFALLCAILSIFSKAMALSLPLVLFLIDHVKGRKFSVASLVDKIPFFLVVEPVALITFVLNSRHIAMAGAGSLKLWAWCGIFYIKTFFWPVHLSPLYAPPVMEKLRWGAHVLLPVSGGIAAWAVFKAPIRRWIGFALLFYFLSTFFLWRFDIDDLNLVADRFMYLPSFGFCLLAGVVIEAWFQTAQSTYRKAIFWAGILLVAGLLVFKSYEQAGVWDNSFHFWSRILKERPNASFALRGRIKASLEVMPPFDYGADADIKKLVDSRYWRLLEGRADTGEVIRRKVFYLRQLVALRDLKIFARDKANTKDFHSLLAVVHENLGRNKDGSADREMNDYALAIALDRNDPELFYKRGMVAVRLGQHRSALRDALRAIKLDPQDPDYYDLAVFCAVAVHDYPLAMGLLNIEADLFPNKPSVNIDRAKMYRLMQP